MAKQSESKGVSLKSVKKCWKWGTNRFLIGSHWWSGDHRPPKSSEYLILEQPFRLLRSWSIDWNYLDHDLWTILYLSKILLLLVLFHQPEVSLGLPNICFAHKWNSKFDLLCQGEGQHSYRVFFTGPHQKMTKCQITCTSLQKSLSVRISLGSGT